jgi:hypothetical protein
MVHAHHTISTAGDQGRRLCRLLSLNTFHLEKRDAIRLIRGITEKRRMNRRVNDRGQLREQDLLL